MSTPGRCRSGSACRWWRRWRTWAWGLTELFAAALAAAREKICPLAQQRSEQIRESLKPLNAILARPEIGEALHVPRPLLLMQLAENDDWFLRELAEHFPSAVREVTAALASGGLLRWPTIRGKRGARV